MKIYIWQGNGVSSAYHDDGTVVVLALTAEHAREIVQGAMERVKRDEWEWRERVEEFKRVRGLPDRGGIPLEHMPAWTELWKENRPKRDEIAPDGDIAAFNREPDRVIDLDVPCIVAFNGGGYD